MLSILSKNKSFTSISIEKGVLETHGIKSWIWDYDGCLWYGEQGVIRCRLAVREKDLAEVRLSFAGNLFVVLLIALLGKSMKWGLNLVDFSKKDSEALKALCFVFAHSITWPTISSLITYNTPYF